jgi:hypothetical protein
MTRRLEIGARPELKLPGYEATPRERGFPAAHVKPGSAGVDS